MSKRARICSATFGVMAIATAAAVLRAGDVASNDGLPPLNEAQTVRFTVPPVVRPTAAYQLSVTFAGTFEQNADLFIWVNDTNTTGHWQRRAFVNSYWQGSTSSSTLNLESGRTYALAFHRINAPAPGYGRPFVQCDLTKADPVTDSAEVLPSVHAEFASGQSGPSTVDLRPAQKSEPAL